MEEWWPDTGWAAVAFTFLGVCLCVCLRVFASVPGSVCVLSVCVCVSLFCLVCFVAGSLITSLSYSLALLLFLFLHLIFHSAASLHL